MFCASMQVDVLPLAEFNSDWMPKEEHHQEPVYVERVSLRNALQGGKPETLLGNIELVEPTFQVGTNAWSSCMFNVCLCLDLSQVPLL